MLLGIGSQQLMRAGVKIRLGLLQRDQGWVDEGGTNGQCSKLGNAAGRSLEPAPTSSNITPMVLKTFLKVLAKGKGPPWLTCRRGRWRGGRSLEDVKTQIESINKQRQQLFQTVARWSARWCKTGRSNLYTLTKSQ